jgi:sulfoxide reductase heme-binding subunit YedZ
VATAGGDVAGERIGPVIATTSTTVWYTMRASGIVALVLLTATTVLGILTAGRFRTPTWPAFAQADLHKRISLLALVFLTLHVLTAVVDTFVPVGVAAFVVPFASGYRPVWVAFGTVAVDLLAAVAISSAIRRRIGFRTWRAIHWLAYGSWPLAMAHALGIGTDASKRWFDAVALFCAVAVLGALAWRFRGHRLPRSRTVRSFSNR